MTDTERLDWLGRHWDFVSTWAYDCGHTLTRNEAVSGTGRTLREAIDALKARYDQVMNQRW